MTRRNLAAQSPKLARHIPVPPDGYVWGFAVLQQQRNQFSTKHHVLTKTFRTWCRWTEGTPIEEAPTKRQTICAACLAKLERDI